MSESLQSSVWNKEPSPFFFSFFFLIQWTPGSGYSYHGCGRMHFFPAGLLPAFTKDPLVTTACFLGGGLLRCVHRWWSSRRKSQRSIIHSRWYIIKMKSDLARLIQELYFKPLTLIPFTDHFPSPSYCLVLKADGKWKWPRVLPTWVQEWQHGADDAIWTRSTNGFKFYINSAFSLLSSTVWLLSCCFSNPPDEHYLLATMKFPTFQDLGHVSFSWVRQMVSSFT